MKKMKNTKKMKIIIISILLIILTTIFFAFKAYFAPDSCWYYYLSLIFDGEVPISNWWSVRGFTLPYYLYLITKIFGNTPIGILIGLYLLYLGMHALFFLILQKLIKYEKWEKYQNKIYVLHFIMLIINPIIIGYSHTVLTESMAPFLILLTLYLCFNWYSNKLGDNLAKDIIYPLVLGILSILMWFLKQPYLPIIILIILFISLCSIIKNHNLKNFIYRILTIVLIIVMVFSTSKLWNNYLKNNNVDTSVTSGYVTNSFTYALNYHYIEQEDKCEINKINESLLSKEEKKKAIKLIKNNKCDNFLFYNVVDDNKNVIDNEIIFVSDKGVSTTDSLIFVLKQLFKYPTLIIDSYYNNYMAVIGLHETVYEDNGYKATDTFKSIPNENESLAMFIFYDGPSYWWKFYINENDYESYLKNYTYGKYMSQFEVDKQVNTSVGNFFNFLFPVYNFIFKSLFFLAPILMIYSFFKFIKEKCNKTYMIMFVSFGASFGHVLFHAVTGAKIDRYAYVAYPLVLLAFILMLFPKGKNHKLMSDEVKK